MDPEEQLSVLLDGEEYDDVTYYDPENYAEPGVWDEEEEEYMAGSEIKTKVSTEAEGLERLRDIARGGHGYTYGILSNEADGLLVTHKSSKPCYGELRPYGSFVNPLQKDTRGKDNKPGDLPHGFPAGEILAVSVPSYTKGQSDPWIKDFQNFWASTEGPWGELFDSENTGYEALHGNINGIENALLGYIWTKPDFGPTKMVSFLMASRSIPVHNTHHHLIWQDRGLTGPIGFYAPMFLNKMEWGSYAGKLTLTGGPYNYELNLMGANLSRFIAGKPFDLDEGLTLRQRAAYNRPNVEYTFGHGYDNSWMQKAPDGTIVADQDYVLEHLQKAFGDTTADDVWSAKGFTPTIPISNQRESVVTVV